MRHLVGFSLWLGAAGALFGCSLSTVGAMDPVQGNKCDQPAQTATAKGDCTECTCNGATGSCDSSACMASGGSGTGGGTGVGGGTGMGATGGSAGRMNGMGGDT